MIAALRPADFKDLAGETWHLGGRRAFAEEAARHTVAIRQRYPEDLDALARRLEGVG